MKSFVFALLAFLLHVGAVSAQGQGTGGAPKSSSAPPSGTTSYAEHPSASPAKPGPAAGHPGASYIPAENNPPAATSGVMSIWNLVQQGGWAMIPLLVMSVLALTMVLVFLATLRRSSILTVHYMNTADVLLKKRDYLGLLAISSRHSEVVARVVQRTLDFATKNPSASFEVVRDVAESEGSSQASALQHRVTYLADIGTLSPMVGLFGTVIGIVDAFGMLGSGQVGNRDWAMAGGVSKALVATAAGLIVGIVSFMFYAYFRNKVQRLISDLEVASAHIVGLMALNYKRRETSRAALEDEF